MKAKVDIPVLGLELWAQQELLQRKLSTLDTIWHSSKTISWKKFMVQTSLKSFPLQNLQSTVFGNESTITSSFLKAIRKDILGTGI